MNNETKNCVPGTFGASKPAEIPRWEAYEWLAFVESPFPDEAPCVVVDADGSDAIGYVFARSLDEAEREATFVAIRDLIAEYGEEAQEMSPRLRVVVRRFA